MKSIEAPTECDGADQSSVGGRRPSRWLWLILVAPLGMMAVGCASGNPTTTGVADPEASPSKLYFAPNMGSGAVATYTIDHTANTNCPTPPAISTTCNDGTFVNTTYSASGATILDSGVIAQSPPNGSTLPDGIFSLDATYVYGGLNAIVTLPVPVSGSWAIELPGQAALVELNIPSENTSQQTMTAAVNFFAPAVPTQSCPNLATAESFQFVTIPENLPNASSTNKVSQGAWNPRLETAYGSVKIATSGSLVYFSNASTYNIFGTECTATTITGATSCVASLASGANQVTSACSPTYYGQVISVPGTGTVNSSGAVSPTATIGIGPSGFLVEDAGSGVADPTTGLNYENLLGAGYGAIGLPQPSSDLTPSLVGAQYQGFLYAPGASGFKVIGSFGGSQNSCNWQKLLGNGTAPNQTPSPNTIYGGMYEYTKTIGATTGTTNDPDGGVNCDIAIDLGANQATNGLYNATVYVDSSFTPLPNGQLPNGQLTYGLPLQPTLYSFSAVAVAGQLKGKNAIFLIGADTSGSPSRAWGIYLLQSN